MPPPSGLELFSPEMQRLLALLESNLYFIAQQPLTREQAIVVKHRMSSPLGVLCSKHGMVTVTELKQKARE